MDSHSAGIGVGRGVWSADGWTYTGRMGVPRELSVQIVRRSSMIMPVNVPKFVEKAWTRGADAIVLDLEDSVTLAEKKSARGMVRDAIPVVAKGGADVMVRINKPFDMAVADLDASIWPGLAGIRFPKAESAEEMRILDRLIAEREMARVRVVAAEVRHNPHPDPLPLGEGAGRPAEASIPGRKLG